MRYKDKVALITAAANGIGRATCDIIAREGGIVVAVDNHQERLDAAVDAMNKAGGRAHGTAVRCARSVAGRCRGGRRGEGVRPDRHPGQRGRRQHDHCAAGGEGRRTVARRVAAADQLQSERNVPVPARCRAGHEGAEERQDRQPGLDRRAGPECRHPRLPTARPKAASSR